MSLTKTLPQICFLLFIKFSHHPHEERHGYQDIFIKN